MEKVETFSAANAVAMKMQPTRKRMRRRIRHMRCGCMLLIGMVSASAQTPTFSADVKVVNLLATARNRDGSIVTDLTKDDFEVEEDGKRQQIRYFARQSDLPLVIGLLIDTSSSQRHVMEQ